MAGLEELLVSIVSKFDEKGFRELERRENSADRATRALSNSLRNMFVGVIGTIGVKEILDASVKMDSLKTSFAALAGSDIGGAEQLKYLREEAQRLGQDFQTSAEAYKNLFSAGKGVGMDDRQIQQVFSSVLEAGTVLGSSEQQMQGALMALEQMISKGKVSMEELRRQLGNALPGAMQIAARAMHTTSQGLQDMLESGLDSKKFVTAFANQLHEEFGDKAVSASHTLRAELARLKNALFELETSFLDGEAGKNFAEVIAKLTAALNSPELRKSLNGIGEFCVFLLKNIDLIISILAAIGFNKLIKFITILSGKCMVLAKGLYKVYRIVRVLGVAKGIFGLLIKGGLAAIPVIGEVATAIWLVVDAIIALVRWIKNLHKTQNEKFEKQKSKPILGSDGEYYEGNPNNPNSMHRLYKYSQEDLKNIITNGNMDYPSGQLTGGAAPVGYRGSLPDLNKSQGANLTFNVYGAQGMDENQIASIVADKVRGIFDDYSLNAGYMNA